MAYIFRKLNNLTGSAGQSDTSAATGGSVIAGTGTSGQTTNKDPYQSTYQNPNKVYEANKNENLGQLETGVTKNIQNTQNELTKSSDAYKSNLGNVDSKYQYNGRQDLENIGDSSTYSRLNSLVSPSSGQTELNNVKSNSQYFNPDTSGVAAASTVSGLSNQLKQQYGTTAGGSRLDAQLYRGSGQAGKAINQNIGQLKDFQVDKTNRLGQEKSTLGNYTKGIADRSTALNTDGKGYQSELLTTAQQRAQADQSKYDTARNNKLSELQSQLTPGVARSKIMEAINKGLDGRKITNNFGTTNKQEISRSLQEAGIPEEMANNLTENSTSYTQGHQEANPNFYQGVDKNGNNSGTMGGNQFNTVGESASTDLTNYLRDKLVNEYSSKADLSGINANQYISGPQTFEANSYIDPRYNQLGALLGTNQMATSGQLSTDVTSRDDALQQAIQAQLGGATSEAENAARALFNSGGGGGGSGGGMFDNINTLLGVANPVLGGNMILANNADKIGSGISSMFGGW